MRDGLPPGHDHDFFDGYYTSVDVPRGLVKFDGGLICDHEPPP